MIVIDFFHWTRHGEWQFDPQCWPDPAGMVKRLEEMGIKVMVSLWPTVSRLSKNFPEMWKNKFIIRNKLGSAAQMYFVDNQAEDGIYLHYYDSTHPGARKFIWEKVKEGYYRHGIKIFWLDACEPEMLPFMPENLRFYAGDGEAVANSYPLRSCPGVLRRYAGRRRKDAFVFMPLGLGGQPALWRSRLVWRRNVDFFSPASPG